MNKPHLRRLVFFLLLTTCAGLDTGRAEDEAAEKEKQTAKWLLPDTAQLRMLNLTISPDQRWVCFFRRTLEGATPSLFAGVGKYVMLDTRNGTIKKVEDLFAKGTTSGLAGSSGEIQFSPSGKLMLVHASSNMIALLRGEVTSLYLVDLESKEVKKLAGGALVIGRWLGESVVITSMTKEEIKPVKVMRVEKAEAKELAVSGLVHACDPMGRFITLRKDDCESFRSTAIMTEASKAMPDRSLFSMTRPPSLPKGDSWGL